MSKQDHKEIIWTYSFRLVSSIGAIIGALAEFLSAYKIFTYSVDSANNHVLIFNAIALFVAGVFMQVLSFAGMYVERKRYMMCSILSRNTQSNKFMDRLLKLLVGIGFVLGALGMLIFIVEVLLMVLPR